MSGARNQYQVIVGSDQRRRDAMRKNEDCKKPGHRRLTFREKKNPPGKVANKQGWRGTRDEEIARNNA